MRRGIGKILPARSPCCCPCSGCARRCLGSWNSPRGSIGETEFARPYRLGPVSCIDGAARESAPARSPNENGPWADPNGPSGRAERRRQAVAFCHQFDRGSRWRPQYAGLHARSCSVERLTGDVPQASEAEFRALLSPLHPGPNASPSETAWGDLD